ncbi:hypothetical protein SAMN03080615_03654 [Amphritea atlantica]|uniref:Uncharacterized protein n=1 Tax=Amphritea atlantica TaxID=355243 RepID=A0A1H9KTE8_9GAMM|nr:hypothetical protein SAMN03080615_03654 [Amphritea atlantica]
MSGRDPLSRDKPWIEWAKALVDRYFQSRVKGFTPFDLIHNKQIYVA